MQGLAENKDDLGAPLCPCRHYDDKQAEADQGFWNCPCVPMRERKVGVPSRTLSMHLAEDGHEASCSPSGHMQPARTVSI